MGALRSITNAFGQLRLDVRTVARSFTQNRPPVFVRRAPTTAAPTRSVRRMKVESIVRETVDAVSITLADPTGAAVHHLPGQFFTLAVRVGEKIVRRNYSASSAPASLPSVTFTVKRVANGELSAHLVDQLRVGDAIDVEGPSGHFTVRPNANTSRSILLIGGGSGITPLMSIARSVLSAEKGSKVALVYGNRRESDVIFHRALHALESEHADRFRIAHVLEEAPEGWKGGRGRLSASNLDLLAGNATSVDDVFVCGPEPMRALVREWLRSKGVSANRIHEERYTLGGTPRSTAGASVSVSLAGASYSIETRAGETILAAATRSKVPLPFSCAMGGCGACRLKLVAGDVEMDEPNCLSPGEKRDGYVLTCVGCARGNVVLEE